MTRKLAAVGLTLTLCAALAALYFSLRPDRPPPPAARVPAAAAPQPRLIQVTVRQGSRIAGPDSTQVRQHDAVILTVLSDTDDELHLHGYDLHLHVHANEPATLRFEATHAGRFEYELHKAHLPLGTLEVLPR